MRCKTTVIDIESLGLGNLMEVVKKKLAEIDIDAVCGSDDDSDTEKAKVKVVCVSPNLKEAVAAMVGMARDQVVMVRVDQETTQTLDAWVETGAVKSRSEAAALFIREGMKVRASELEKIKDALSEVRAARDRLHREARDAFGLEEEDQAGDRA